MIKPSYFFIDNSNLEANWLIGKLIQSKLDPNWAFIQIPHKFFNNCIPFKTLKLFGTEGVIWIKMNSFDFFKYQCLLIKKYLNEEIIRHAI